MLALECTEAFLVGSAWRVMIHQIQLCENFARPARRRGLAWPHVATETSALYKGEE